MNLMRHKKINVQLGNTKEVKVEGKSMVKVETNHGKVKANR